MTIPRLRPFEAIVCDHCGLRQYPRPRCARCRRQLGLRYFGFELPRDLNRACQQQFIGSLVHELRLRRKMSQAALGQASAVNRSIISRLEHGHAVSHGPVETRRRARRRRDLLSRRQRRIEIRIVNCRRRFAQCQWRAWMAKSSVARIPLSTLKTPPSRNPCLRQLDPSSPPRSRSQPRQSRCPRGAQSPRLGHAQARLGTQRR